jgi:stearoyl-CoA desaturase (delta-9 desaturase)
MVLQRKELLLDRLCDIWYVKKDELEKKVLELSDRIVKQIAETNQLKEYYRQVRQQGKERQQLKEVKKQISQCKRSLKQDWRQWGQLSRNILRLKPLSV